MQKEIKELAEKSTCKVVWQGEIYTVIHAEYKNELGRYFQAEGIARRSYKDPLNQTTGCDIASGRALKALWRKIQGGKKALIHHRFMG
jgi:hypothetical protein